MSNIVILGAGVSGLTCALLLARNGGHNITIVAKHMPGDYDIEYASPWAGADFVPNMAGKQEKSPAASGDQPRVEGTMSLAERFERETFPELARLAKDLPEAGIHFQEERVFLRTKDVNTPKGEWFANLVKSDSWILDQKVWPKTELPPGMDAGFSFTSVCINTALYLPWLASQCLKLGVKMRRGIVAHVTDAAGMHHTAKRADLVINCTGLSSLTLGGVEDKALYPGRGQIVVVRNDPGFMISVSGTDDGSDESCYFMPRAAGGGTILGGCMQAGVWDSQPDLNLAVRIMTRAVEAYPQLVPDGKGIEGLSIVRHGVGLRPMRTGSVRVEREIIDGVPVVHNYGHGGYGYQTSYGAAQEVEKLVNESLKQQARL